MIGIIGGGGWGTALAKHCAQKGYQVGMWVMEPEIAAEINRRHTNQTFLPGAPLPESLYASNSLEEIVSRKKFLIIAVPSLWLRQIARKMADFVDPQTIIISTTKGLELQSYKLMTVILAEELPSVNPDAIIALSGPTHAEEVAQGIPSAAVVSTPNQSYAQEAQDLLISPLFRIYTNPDRIGVQLGGALKNVIALAAGISDGLGFGDNTKAALVTRGLVEISRLGLTLGAKKPTFAGLSGMGDLFVTASSIHSRNSWAGRELGKGKTLAEVIASTKMVVEGVNTTRAAYELARQLKVELPITEVTYRILFEGLSPQVGVRELMERAKTHEMEELV
ncbi:MAG: NAD(P)-dependent glycerol-3-phosphate dehydrogenase [Firmicutes bacterium]|nr:NAD(P)-dependent glycerol-3-phosphate dehydrogenase [Bacillota bacterium]